MAGAGRAGRNAAAGAADPGNRLVRRRDDVSDPGRPGPVAPGPVAPGPVAVVPVAVVPVAVVPGAHANTSLTRGHDMRGERRPRCSHQPAVSFCPPQAGPAGTKQASNSLGRANMTCIQATATVAASAK